jgi:hypothetical protein
MSFRRAAKLKEIAKREDRSVANVLELIVNRFLDSVDVEQFGITGHPGFMALTPPQKRI